MYNDRRYYFLLFFFVSQLGMGMGINQAENTEKEMNIYL